jgi:hypothetical protein
VRGDGSAEAEVALPDRLEPGLERDHALLLARSTATIGRSGLWIRVRSRGIVRMCGQPTPSAEEHRIANPVAGRPTTPAASTQTVAAQLLALQRTAGNHATARLLDAFAGVESIAARGMSAAGGPMPHLDALRRSFGRHDPAAITAHRDPAAAKALGAKAYAVRGEVVFGRSLDLWRAGHEAAHALQQRAGRAPATGSSRRTDAVEREADGVADRVVAGTCAESLIDGWGKQAPVPASGSVLRLPDEELVVGEEYLITHNLQQLIAKLVDKTDVTCVFHAPSVGLEGRRGMVRAAPA